MMALDFLFPYGLDFPGSANVESFWIVSCMFEHYVRNIWFCLKSH